MVRVSKDVSNL